MPSVLRALLLGATVLVAGAALHAFGLWPLPDGNLIWNHWAAVAVPCVAAASVITRAILVEAHRWAWATLGAGLACWAVADALWTFAFDHGQTGAELALFLALYPCAAVFLILDVRERCAHLRAGVWLDLLAGVLAVAAIGFAIVLPALPGERNPTTLAFPILDVALIALVMAVLSVSGRAPGRDWLTWCFAFLALAVGDLVWVAGGAWPASVSVVLWAVGPLALGWAPWIRARPLAPGARPANAALMWPFALFSACFGVIVVGNYVAVPPAGLWLAAASMVVSTYRAALAHRTIRALPETRRQARTDELTGLINRRGFLDALERRLRRHPDRPAAVLMLDLDRFKELNDTLGHAAGDRLLAELGPRLSAALRPGDMLARLGGDEFAVLCPCAAAPGAHRTARRLQDALEQPFAIDDLSVHVDASLGIATYPTDGVTVAQLLARADVAMYQAKGDGTRVEQYDASRDEHSLDRLALVGELRRALDRGDGLELHYQPQECLRTGRILAVEALVRWRHPTRGLLAPDAFLNVAESAGLMRRLGRRVLRDAIAQAASWQRQGEATVVAINLATADIVDGTLAREVAELLDGVGLDGSGLKLELTESTVMAQPERVIATLHELRALGCRISLDDFGTGHASLEHLVRLPVDELKIDRSFVAGIDTGMAGAAAIVRALALLGRDLALAVVAEGVETPRAWGQLVAAGCSSAQGYLLSPPLPAGELQAWLRARRRVEEHAA